MPLVGARCTYAELGASTKVLDVGVVVLGVDAAGGALFAQAAHAVQLAVRVPRLVVVAADLHKGTNAQFSVQLEMFSLFFTGPIVVFGFERQNVKFPYR